MKAIKREQPEWFSRVVDATRREAALSRLRAVVREGLNLPSFERWSKHDTQTRMF